VIPEELPVSYRRLSLAVGVLALGIGLAATLVPGFVSLGLGRVVVSVVGGLALLQAVRVVRSRRGEPLDEATMPDPERPVETPSPGAAFETALAGLLGADRIYYHPKRIREGLRAAAVDVLVAYGGDDESTARERLATGRWTDDAYAAAFLAGEPPPAPSLRDRLRAAAGRESTLQRSVRRTVDAIAAVAGVEPRPDAVEDRHGRGPTLPIADDGDAREWSLAGDDGDAPAGDGGVPARRATGHWRGASVVALLGLGIGALVEQPAVVLAGVVGIGFAAYASSGALPPGEVSIERTVSSARPEPDEAVEVTVAVTNESDRFLPDVRLVDGVPEALAVADGSPRFGTALRPGETASFTYSITARRGIHGFGPAVVAARNLNGTVETERRIDAETTLTCVPALRATAAPLPLRRDATQQVGRVGTETGGEGVEFYATREYRPNDALNRIDWNRRARTGELTTVEFREERAARVVLLIDARQSAYVSPTPRDPHAVDRSVAAAGRLYATLAAAGNRVGLAAVGDDDCWLPPGSGVDHETRARELLATHPALAPVPGGSRAAPSDWEERFRRRLAGGTQLIVFTPLVDETGAGLVRRLEAYGHPATVVSPDPTADRTAGDRLTRVARTLRTSRLRRAGIPVLDWAPDEPIDAAVGRYGGRRST